MTLPFEKYKSALIFWWIVDQFYEKILDRKKIADTPVERYFEFLNNKNVQSALG